MAVRVLGCEAVVAWVCQGKLICRDGSVARNAQEKLGGVRHGCLADVGPELLEAILLEFVEQYEVPSVPSSKPLMAAPPTSEKWLSAIRVGWGLQVVV